MKPSPCEDALARAVRRIRTTLDVLLLVLCAGVTIALAQDARPASPDVAAFNTATREYVAMHRRLEQLVGPITLNSSVESINRSMQALAAAIRGERAHAQQGEFFTPALAAELRISVRDALFDHGFTTGQVIAGQILEGVDPRSAAALRVNDTFPWGLATAMFPCVIAALPPLPSELQYRIVGNDLLLIDVHASLVVDILPNLLADLTHIDQ